MMVGWMVESKVDSSAGLTVVNSAGSSAAWTVDH